VAGEAPRTGENVEGGASYGLWAQAFSVRLYLLAFSVGSVHISELHNLTKVRVLEWPSHDGQFSLDRWRWTYSWLQRVSGFFSLVGYRVTNARTSLSLDFAYVGMAVMCFMRSFAAAMEIAMDLAQS
jgi:hypothetical protein